MLYICVGEYKICLTLKLSILTRAIRTTGLTMKEFCLQKLGIPYVNFHYRLSHNCLRLGDYHAIMFWTGKSFDQLFPNPLLPAPIQPIPFRLPSISSKPPIEAPSLTVEASKPLQPTNIVNVAKVAEALAVDELGDLFN
jgi:hypothetical protein